MITVSNAHVLRFRAVFFSYGNLMFFCQVRFIIVYLDVCERRVASSDFSGQHC